MARHVSATPAMGMPEGKARRIVKQGASRVLTISRLIPDEWRAVFVEVIQGDANSVTLRVTRIS